MSMSELHKPEWYGECAIISDKYNDYFKSNINVMEQVVSMTTLFSLVLT